MTGRDRMKEVMEAIKKAKKVLVVGHIMPDGDDISSVLSLSKGLRSVGKEVMSGIDWKIPWIFEDLEEVKDIVNYQEFLDTGFDPDLMVVVDVSSPDRIGNFQNLIGKIPVAVIDHHATNDEFADYNWVDRSFGACAQMILRVNKELGVEYDENLATINLMGILTDTGFLRFPNADARVYEDATELVKLGGKPHRISAMILENKRIEQFHLFADVLEKMRTELNGKLVYSYVTQEMYKKHNCTDEDSTGFVHELRSIRGVEVAIMFMEIRPKLVHVSMRSKEWFDLSKFAKSIGGGGHPRAAGASIEGKDVFEVMEYVIPKLKEEMSRGENS